MRMIFSLNVLFLFFILTFPTSALAKKTIVIIGDSLTEGYNIAEKDSFPAILENNLKQKYNEEVKVINGGIAGSTTAGGLKRLNWYLKAQPDIVVIALGANDGLRGLKLDQSKSNLESMIKSAKEKNLKILLLGMRIPPNYGKKYTENFQKMYQDLAKQYHIPLMPFLLKDVAAKKELNLPDGIHPNEKGYKIIAENVQPYIEKLLEK